MYAAIVTGARGQDGSYLCELLEEKGYHVVNVDCTVVLELLTLLCCGGWWLWL